MKKIFTFLCILMLGAGMSMWANGNEPQLPRISNRHNAAQVEAPDAQHTEEEAIWTLIQSQSCVIRRTSAGANTYNITLYSTEASSNNNSSYPQGAYFTNVAIDDVSFIGGKELTVNGGYCWGSGNDNKYGNAKGYIKFIHEYGSTYLVDVRVSVNPGSGYNYYYSIITVGRGMEMPVYVQDENGNNLELNEPAENYEDGTVATFKYGNSHDVINMVEYDYAGEFFGSPLSCWYPTDKRYFVRLQAYNTELTQNNFIQLGFWVDNVHRQNYNGVIGPKEGLYTVGCGQEGGYWYDCTGNSTCYWASYTAEQNYTVINYMFANGGVTSKSDERCAVSSFKGDYNNGTVTPEEYTLPSLYADKILVEKGKGGNIYIRLIRGNTNTITIGEVGEKCTISVNSEDNNKGTTSGSGTYNVGENIQISATPTLLYVFDHWDDNNTDNPRTVTVNSEKTTYTAYFKAANFYTISASAEANGSVQVVGTEMSAGKYKEGSTVKMTATGLNGYVFSQWNDGNTDNPRTITVTGNDSYTAQFVLPGMTVVSCSSGTGISFHCDYSDITDHHKCTKNVEGKENELYYVSSGYIYFANTIAIKATNSQNNSMTLYLTSRENNTTRKYSGGECNNVNGPEVQTYPIYFAKLYYTTDYCNSGFYSVNDNSVSYSTVAYRSNTCGSYSYSTTYYSKITYNGTEYKLRTRAEGDGVIKVNENNVGGIFIESEYVQDYNRNNNIYFTLGNRSENTANLGTGTMSVTPSTLTMSASNGNHSASIRLNNNTTGNKTLSDFNVANCSFVYDGTSITEISDMTGTLTANNGTYTLSLKIRDCSQNLYIVTMSAVAPSFSLTWNANGKSVTGGTAAGSVQWGSAITAPSNNTNGYNLTWSPSVPSTMPAQNVTYTAQWSAINYSITYNQNDGTGATNGTYTIESNTITLPTASAMTKTGHTFDGWYDNSGFTGSAITTIPQGSTGNKTFWAKWTAKTYTVNLDNQSATTAGQESVTATYGQALPSIASNLPEKAGHIFDGYYTEQNGGGTKFYNADGSSANNWNIDTDPTTLVAKWIRLYTITIADYTGGTVTVSYNDGSDQSFTSGSRNIAQGIEFTITAEAAPHYSLTSLVYSGEQNNDGNITSGAGYEVDGDHTITAVFTGDSYDITYKDKDNADYSGSNFANLPAKHTYGTQTNLVNGVRSGYNFLGWYENENCTGDAVTSIGATAKTAAFTLYAKWERNVVSYNVTFTAGEHGSVSGAIGETAITSGQPQEEGSTVTLTATPDNFYSFVEWRNASNEQVVSTNAEYSFTLAEAVNLTAVFALQETIELTDNFENGSQWQDDYADLLDMLRTGSDKAGKAKQKDVQLNRTFAAERWSTFALPFGYSLSSNQTHPFYGHVYSLVSAQYEEKGGKGYLTLNCMPNTTSIKANTPYVLITDKDAPIANPVFNNVRLTEIEENTTTVVQDVNNTGSVRFVNTEYRQRIDKIEQYGVNSKENKSVIYLSGNKLYYPGGAIYQNAFRAYFVMNYSTIYHVAPRVRLVMPNGESVEQAEEETVETKKYIENGILVIERNGIKYDAQGHVIK